MPHNHSHNTTKNIKLAFFLNISFTLIELVGGYMTNSVAIMSDAIHDLGDSISLLMAWFLEHFSNKEKTTKFSYGFKRFSLLGALINSIILFIGSMFILTRAIPRLVNPQETSAEGMFLLAIFGILVNGFAAYKTSKGRTLNERVVSLHMLEDVLGWVAVLFVSIVMFYTDATILDPILSILITFYILWGVLKNIKKTALLFLQAVPDNLNPDLLEKEIIQDKAITGVHDTHVWSLDGAHHILSTHIIIAARTNTKIVTDIKCGIKEKMYKLGIEHTTLEIEYEGEKCEHKN